MDSALIRTFLEVAASGSFVAASDRLHVTQSAVSLRIARLEESLGRPVFLRSRAGAELTPAGQAFLPYAQSLAKIWSQARQHIGVPERFSHRLSIGAELSLWPRLGFRWIDGLRAALPDLNLNVEHGTPEQLLRAMTEGVMQAALTFVPQMRAGLRVEEVLRGDLVLASARPTGLEQIDESYAMIDWGPEFIAAHDGRLPVRAGTGLVLALGSMAVSYVVSRGLSAYLPAREIRRHLDEGTLHLVPGAPRFAYSVWAMWRDDLDETIAKVTQDALARAVEHAEGEDRAVLTRLRVNKDLTT